MPRYSRRETLGLGAALLALAPLPGKATLDNTGPLLLSAASDADDRHWVVGVRWRGTEIETLFREELPERAHHIAVNEALDCYVVVARRPGTWLQLGTLSTGRLHDEVRVPADRHVFGHGVFSADGKRFYTTESAFDNMTGDSGLVVEWQVEGSGATTALRRLREFSTRGVGPHELSLHPDGDTLIVANGGIRTHPDSARENLNPDTMLPSLVYLDRHDGALLEQRFLPEEYHQASIRHLDVNAAGLVALVMQFEGEPFLQVPLVATHIRGETLRLLLAPPELQSQIKQYVGSVRFDQGGRYFAASCPRGNLLTFWDAESGELIDSRRARDGCGLCAVADGFVFSTGTGRLGHVDLAAGTVNDFSVPPALEHLFWDNHMSRGEPG